MNADAGIFDPGSDKCWGVEAVSLFRPHARTRPPRRGRHHAQHGAPTGNGQYDIVWAKEVLKPGHPDHEAFKNPRHPRHAEIIRLRNEAYALHHGG